MLRRSWGLGEPRPRQSVLGVLKFCRSHPAEGQTSNRSQNALIRTRKGNITFWGVQQEVSCPSSINIITRRVELSANKTPCINRWGSVTIQLQNAHTFISISVSPFVWDGLEPTKRIFMKFYVERFYLNMWNKNSSLVKIVQNKTLFTNIYIQL